MWRHRRGMGGSMTSEIDDLRAELARLWDAVAPVLPPQKKCQVTATKAHNPAGVAKGDAGEVFEVIGKSRIAYFPGPGAVISFDVTDPNCGVEWSK